MREKSVVEESGFAERVDQVLLQFGHPKIARDLDQVVPQIEFTVLAIEKFETRDERAEMLVDDENGLALRLQAGEALPDLKPRQRRLLEPANSRVEGFRADKRS